MNYQLLSNVTICLSNVDQTSTNFVQNYLVKVESKDLNLKRVNNLFRNCVEGNSKLSFIIKFDDYEIFVESKIGQGTEFSFTLQKP